MKKLLMIFALAFSGLLASEFTIVTEEYPPFNFTNNNELQGVSTEILKEMCQRLEHPFKPEILPWARGYLMAKTKENIILYSTTRLPSREKLFKWVGPLVTNHLGFFVKRGAAIEIQSYEDAKKLSSIGTYKDDAAELYLRSLEFTNVDSVSDDVLNAKKLVIGRIDAWYTGVIQGFYRASQAGVVERVENIYKDPNPMELYLAFSKNTDDAEIKIWQSTLDKLIKDGTYDKIMQKYLVE